MTAGAMPLPDDETTRAAIQRALVLFTCTAVTFLYAMTVTIAGDGLSFTVTYAGSTASWALGLARWDIKFVFPNRESIYLHHTPSLQLFERARRDFSHGCIRVADPAAVAQLNTMLIEVVERGTARPSTIDWYMPNTSLPHCGS